MHNFIYIYKYIIRVKKIALIIFILKLQKLFIHQRQNHKSNKDMYVTFVADYFNLIIPHINYALIIPRLII